MKQRYLTAEELARIKGEFYTVSIDEEERPPIYVSPEEFLPLMKMLKNDHTLSFTHLSCLTAVDWKDTIDVVYYLFSELLGAYVVVKVKTIRNHPEIPSVTSVFPGAEFEEREVYDLMGVRFTGHPDMRRILMPEGFKGHPLRKDFTYKKPAPPKATRVGEIEKEADL